MLSNRTATSGRNELPFVGLTRSTKGFPGCGKSIPANKKEVVNDQNRKRD